MSFSHANGRHLPQEIEMLLGQSDDQLLAAVAEIESQPEQFDFDGFVANHSPVDSNRGFMQIAASFERTVLRRPTYPWLDVLEDFVYCAESDLYNTIRKCRQSTAARVLHSFQAIPRLAIVAWRRRQDSLLGKLDAMPETEKRSALRAMAFEAAVSSAYEGIDIDPEPLADSLMRSIEEVDHHSTGK